MNFDEGEFWYPVLVKSRQELNVVDNLRSKGIICFTPLKKEIRQCKNGIAQSGNHKHRTKETIIAHPSFKRYILCFSDLSKTLGSLTEYYVINTTPGVLTLIGINDKALVIDDSAMNSFLSIMDDDFVVIDTDMNRDNHNEDGFKKGDEIELLDNSVWHGYKAVFDHYISSDIAEIFLSQMQNLTGGRLKVETGLIKLIDN